MNNVDITGDVDVSNTLSAQNLNEDITNKAYTLNNKINTYRIKINIE